MKIKGMIFFINKCNEPTGDGTTTFHPTIEWLGKVTLQPITPMQYSKHECGISEKKSIKSHLGLPEVTHLNPSNLDSTSWSKITKNHHQIGIHPSLPGLPERLSNQGFQN